MSPPRPLRHGATAQRNPSEGTEMMKAESISRRTFLAAASAVSAMAATPHPILALTSTEKPALLGGQPVRTAPFPSPAWPIYGAEEEQALLDVVRSGCW